MTQHAPAPASGEVSDERPHVSVVLPAYNEAERLPDGLDRVIGYLRAQPYASEVIVTDDGSVDATPDIVRARAGAADRPHNVRVRLLQHARNQGKGAAIRTGMLAAEGDFVVFMDADLATPPDEIGTLLGELERGAGVVSGSRIQPDGSDMRASQPFQRRLAGKAFTIMRKALRVLPDIDDTQCPMKGFTHEAAQQVFRRQRLRGWIFDAEVLYVARSLGFRIVEVPVQWRHVEGSRLRVRPQQAWEILRDLVRLRLSRLRS